MRSGPGPPDYVAIERNLWHVNARNVEVLAAHRDRNLMKKTATYSWRYGVDESAILEKILSDRMFANLFAIEPRRQGLHERIAAERVGELPNVESFAVLPKAGPASVHITSDGQLQTLNARSQLKSLDFQWQPGGWHCFATHKYTREGGGNQDSQFKEVVRTMRNFMQGQANDEVVLFAILDGPYFSQAKMDEVGRYARAAPPFSLAISIGELPGLPEKFARMRSEDWKAISGPDRF